MKPKQILSIALAAILSFSFCIPAYASDDVNVDNILHGDSDAKGRYSHSGNDWGWVVECYVATTDTGKLDVNKSLTDTSNAAYLGRVVFTSSGADGRVPALQRPVAIQLNGGGSLPQLTGAEPKDCATYEYPDPFTTGSATLQTQFQTTSPPLANFWILLGNGDVDVSRNKVAAVVSQAVKDKVIATGSSKCVDPTAPNCPVEYAFVLTPIVYLKINPGTYSSIDWTEQFWMGANEGAVLNRASIIKAQADLQQFYANTAGSALVGTPLYEIAESRLKTACTKGELHYFQNMSHEKLPDSAFLDHNQFGISTPNRYA